MAKPIRAKEPFRFFTRLHLSELTGLRAETLGELSALIKEVPGSCIYHHTHRFLQQHQYLSPEPPNDFAYWVTTVLGDEDLGEKLASIDTVQFSSIRSLRDKITQTIEGYLKENQLASKRFSSPGQAFHFIKSVSFVLATPHAAYDLQEFIRALKKVAIDSIYYHIFESRLRLEKKQNDFSLWIETELGDRELAQKIAKLDPYTHTLEDLRKTLIQFIKQRMLR